jgi:hypothetical protein
MRYWIEHVDRELRIIRSTRDSPDGVTGERKMLAQIRPERAG